MILCIGEILADMIGTEKDGSVFYERKAGGAPFNVACAAKKLGAKTAFVGCVGDDIIGDFLIGFANGRDLDKVEISRDGGRNTTLAFVEIDGSGERSFCFYRKNTADSFLSSVPAELFDGADIVHIGSLMLSEEEGRKYAIATAKHAREKGKFVSFDVNFRTDIFRDEKTAIEIYKGMLELADIVKFSEDEVEIFGDGYIRGLKDKLVCISLGGRGSEWRYKGNSGVVPSIKVSPVDTTGAGDAFYGGVLKGLDGVPASEWTAEKLDGIFKFANVCGALNTLGRGAIDGLPDAATVEKMLVTIK